MISECCVSWCEERGGADSADNKVTYHGLPKNSRRRKLWLAALGPERPKATINKIRVCSRHFREEDFVQRGPYGRRLLPTAVPRIIAPEKQPAVVEELAAPDFNLNVEQVSLGNPNDELRKKDEEIAQLKGQLSTSEMIIRNLQEQVCRLEHKCFELETTSKKFCLETLKTLEKWCEFV